MHTDRPNLSREMLPGGCDDRAALHHLDDTLSCCVGIVNQRPRCAAGQQRSVIGISAISIYFRHALEPAVCGGSQLFAERDAEESQRWIHRTHRPSQSCSDVPVRFSNIRQRPVRFYIGNAMPGIDSQGLRRPDLIRNEPFNFACREWNAAPAEAS